MEEILKAEKSKSHKEFENLLKEDLGNRKFKEGEITSGTVSKIGKKYIFIDLGLKSEERQMFDKGVASVKNAISGIEI